MPEINSAFRLPLPYSVFLIFLHACDTTPFASVHLFQASMRCHSYKYDLLLSIISHSTACPVSCAPMLAGDEFGIHQRLFDILSQSLISFLSSEKDCGLNAILPLLPLQDITPDLVVTSALSVFDSFGNSLITLSQPVIALNTGLKLKPFTASSTLIL